MSSQTPWWSSSDARSCSNWMLSRSVAISSKRASLLARRFARSPSALPTCRREPDLHSIWTRQTTLLHPKKKDVMYAVLSGLTGALGHLTRNVQICSIDRVNHMTGTILSKDVGHVRSSVMDDIKAMRFLQFLGRLAMWMMLPLSAMIILL